AIGTSDSHSAVSQLEVRGRSLKRVSGQLLEVLGELAAPATEAPPQGMLLDPPVPVPVAIRSVSPCTTRTRSGDSESRSAMICANAVWWPCPFDCVPASRVTWPSLSSRSVTVSGPLLPQAST